MVEKLFAFVLMPFDLEFMDVYTLGIKDCLEKAGVLAERVDEQVFHREGILERIYNQIEIADLIVADMTGRNPNVFYEVGYAHAKNKLCVLLTRNADDIPFDLKHHRHIVYNSVSDLRTKIQQDLFHIKAELAERASPIPHAESRPAYRGQSTSPTPSACATQHAICPAAPPKATRA